MSNRPPSTPPLSQSAAALPAYEPHPPSVAPVSGAAVATDDLGAGRAQARTGRRGSRRGLRGVRKVKLFRGTDVGAETQQIALGTGTKSYRVGDAHRKCGGEYGSVIATHLELDVSSATRMRQKN